MFEAPTIRQIHSGCGYVQIIGRQPSPNILGEFLWFSSSIDSGFFLLFIRDSNVYMFILFILKLFISYRILKHRNDKCEDSALFLHAS